MRILQYLLSTVLVFAFNAHLKADSWLPFTNYLNPDDNGNYYVVVKRLGYKETEISYCKKAKGSKAVEYYREPNRRGRNSEEPKAAKVRAGDHVLWKATIMQTPMRVIVASDGSGFVALDSHGSLGHGNILTIVTKDGKIARTESLSSLFTLDERSKFEKSISSISWLLTCWYDEHTKEAIVLAGHGLIKTIPFSTAPIRNGEVQDLARAVNSNVTARQSSALDLLAYKSSNIAVSKSIEILEDDSNPLPLRLRAGFYLAVHNDHRAEKLYLEVINAPTKEKRDRNRSFAFANIGKVKPSIAIPLLLKFIESNNQYDQQYATYGLTRIGETTAPALMKLLNKPNLTNATYIQIARVLGEVGKPAIVPRLLALYSDKERWALNAALNAAIKIDCPQLHEILVGLLMRGCSDDVRIAMYFSKNYHPRALSALRLAKSRFPAKSTTQNFFSKAIDYQLNPK